MLIFYRNITKTFLLYFFDIIFFLLFPIIFTIFIYHSSNHFLCNKTYKFINEIIFKQSVCMYELMWTRRIFSAWSYRFNYTQNGWLPTKNRSIFSLWSTLIALISKCKIVWFNQRLFEIIYLNNNLKCLKCLIKRL